MFLKPAHAGAITLPAKTCQNQVTIITLKNVKGALSITDALFKNIGTLFKSFCIYKTFKSTF